MYAETPCRLTAGRRFALDCDFAVGNVSVL